MRWLIRFVIVFALAVAISLVARYSDGYALLVYPPYRIEVSIPVLVLGLLAIFIALHTLFRAVSHTLRLPTYVTTFRQRRRETRGTAALRNAWEAFLEGRFGRAQKYAARAYGMKAAPALSALLAARSAHSLRDFGQRDEWLERAAQVPGESRSARLSTRAEMLLDERRYDEARTILREMHENGPKHVATLRLLLRAEQGMQNWDEVLRLLSILDKRDVRSRPFTQPLRVTAAVENLKQKGLDATALREFWKRLRREDKLEPRIATTAAKLFIRLGGCKEAHRIIADALNANWSQELVLLYGECQDDDALDRIQYCETWLLEHPRDAALLLTLGRLCTYRELWGKAQSFFEASLSQQPTRAAHRELARLYERIGREEEAGRHYRFAADEAIPA